MRKRLEIDWVSVTEIKIPDIGDFKNIPVLEIMAASGDIVEKEHSRVTLESDNASM
jgi:pyruvate/2-oxoglutarate dehydrogenase complex dihydrolipoamide acyltransferase (E2) component